jgi:hypothetical protein
MPGSGIRFGRKMAVSHDAHARILYTYGHTDQDVLEALVAGSGLYWRAGRTLVYSAFNAGPQQVEIHRGAYHGAIAHPLDRGPATKIAVGLAITSVALWALTCGFGALVTSVAGLVTAAIAYPRPTARRVLESDHTALLFSSAPCYTPEEYNDVLTTYGIDVQTPEFLTMETDWRTNTEVYVPRIFVINSIVPRSADPRRAYCCWRDADGSVLAVLHDRGLSIAHGIHSVRWYSS